MYYGRGDKTNIRLPEPEVERLYQRRAWWNRDAADMLARHMATDTLIDRPHLPYLYAVPRPVGGWQDMCRDVVSGVDWGGKIMAQTRDLVWEDPLRSLRTKLGVPPRAYEFCSTLSQAVRSERGAMLSDREITSSPNLRPNRRLEISEDGELRLVHNPQTHTVNIYSLNGDVVSYVAVHVAEIVLVTRELPAVAKYIADWCGHSSMWDFGLGIDSMRATRPMVDVSGPSDVLNHSYPGNDYAATTRASVLELAKSPGAVAERLAGRLYRTFEINDEKFLSIFDDVPEQIAA